MRTKQEEKVEALRVTEFSKLCTKSAKCHNEFLDVLHIVNLSHEDWLKVFNKFNEYVKIENDRVTNVLKRL